MLGPSLRMRKKLEYPPGCLRPFVLIVCVDALWPNHQSYSCKLGRFPVFMGFISTTQRIKCFVKAQTECWGVYLLYI